MEEEKIKMLQSFFKERHITQRMICERVVAHQHLDGAGVLLRRHMAAVKS